MCSINYIILFNIILKFGNLFGIHAYLTFVIKQIPKELLQNTLKCLVGVVNSESAMLASIAMQALGHIGLYAPLPSLVSNSSSGDVIPMLILFIAMFVQKA